MVLYKADSSHCYVKLFFALGSNKQKRVDLFVFLAFAGNHLWVVQYFLYELCHQISIVVLDQIASSKYNPALARKLDTL